MKVIVLITVEKAGWGWDDKSIKREVIVEAPDSDVLISATIGVIQGINHLVVEAITERQHMIEAEETEDDNN